MAMRLLLFSIPLRADRLRYGPTRRPADADGAHLSHCDLGMDVAAHQLRLAAVAEDDALDVVLSGSLAASPRGENGFGWDVIFVPDGESRTFAEMTAEEKNSRSHRSRAFAELRRLLS